MPTVSILIPAFTPTYLAKALLSAVNQTYKDIEILVGDDTADGDLRSIVEELNHPLIQYFHHGFQNPLQNTQALWDKAQGKYIKWLFDDDFLMPQSVEILVQALKLHPDSVMAFHQRVYINAEDKVTHTPAALIPQGTFALMDRLTLVKNMLPQLNNFVGEPSNILLNREYVDQTTVRQYGAYRPIFLTDVSMYLKHAERAPVVAAGAYLSAFRRHESQASGAASPIRSAGFFEWEIFVRGEAATGNLNSDEIAAAKNKLTRFYTTQAPHLPELAPFLQTLDELTTLSPDKLPGSEAFLQNVKHARDVIDTRIADRKERAAAQRAARQSPVLTTAQSPQGGNLCVVCSQPVGAWKPHPGLESWKNNHFMRGLETVGSTLERHNCPKCGCNDRDRHLWLYMTRIGLIDKIPSMRILHIAPEARLEPLISTLKPREYVAGDLFPRQAHHRKINVQSLDFTDEQFDLIICNHVLEHVDDPAVALSEFERCLSPHGLLIAQTPYSPILKRTMETSKPMSVEFQTRYYGQNDHVRLFGADIVDYFNSAGLCGGLYPHYDLLADINADQYGINAREPFFLFGKNKDALPLQR